MKSELRSLTHPFPLLYDSRSEVLILGSFPSVKAVKEGYYYANPHNRFYKVLSAVFNVDFVNGTWEEKQAILLNHKIALHDVIGYCQIIGSSDRKISDVRPSNLRKIFADAKIKLVICNGAKAYQEYMRFFADVNLPVIQVPSTSPANAKMRLHDLVAFWSKALKVILPM